MPQIERNADTGGSQRNQANIGVSRPSTVSAHGDSLIWFDRNLFIALAAPRSGDQVTHGLIGSALLTGGGYWRHARADPRRTDRLALYMRANAARQAADDDAVRVV